MHVCSSCHGPGGHSISSTFPRLAGQQKDYLIAQLTAFRDHKRADPHAQTYMWGMAARLTDPMIAALAAYYAAQPPVPGTPDNSPEAAAGRKIYTKGIAAENVPACVLCHGEKGAGNGRFHGSPASIAHISSGNWRLLHQTRAPMKSCTRIPRV